ncbi:hypothetical protein MWU75_15760 [Ornithinimicrobium sp. F0845]|uniref:hypothetical protein n=1 Tax=Ornithinimicrobium sp. F0845 TaxID=2926412 RepID=UPI001FF2B780|nr:hypothetical protein [Ornithinimicrobium sp. F0845]MCK0113602.1 hypothetical protein [Ornithinimicrobium sp. F0845]
MTTDGSRPESDHRSEDPAEGQGSTGHRVARSGALLGPALFAVIGAVLIILAIVLI